MHEQRGGVSPGAAGPWPLLTVSAAQVTHRGHHQPLLKEQILSSAPREGHLLGTSGAFWNERCISPLQGPEQSLAQAARDILAVGHSLHPLEAANPTLSRLLLWLCEEKPDGRAV